MTTEFIVGTLCALATVVLLCVDMTMWPSEAECPKGFLVDGVTATGVYQCRISYGCVDEVNVRGGWKSHCDGALEYTRRIFCLPSERAVIDLRGIVRCQAK